MNENEIRTALDTLAELRTDFEIQDIARNLAVTEAVPPEIGLLIAQINNEFKEETVDLKARISVLEGEVKKAVVARGGTVNGFWLNGLWVRGRVTWTTKLLEALAVETPAILDARKVGNPHCRITKAKKK